MNKNITIKTITSVIILFCFWFLLSPLLVSAADCICKELDGGKIYEVEVSCPDEHCRTGACASGQYYAGGGCSPKPPPEVESSDPSPSTGGSSVTLQPPKIQVNILGVQANLKTLTCPVGGYCEIDWTSQYIAVLFRYGISLAIALATVMIMIGGLVWLMSGGRQEQIGRAKEFITGALTGLVISLVSVILLQAINPGLTIFKPLRIFIPDYAKMQAENRQRANEESAAMGGNNCPSPEQQSSGFQGVATSYSKPNRNQFNSDRDFLCAVGLNCWCPNNNDRDRSQPVCPGGLHPCKPFDPNTTPYCNQTASGVAPGPGQVAADPRCFRMGTKVCINGQTYTVTDTGSAIVGTRFDIWNDDYRAAINYGRQTVNVTVGPCP